LFSKKFRKEAARLEVEDEQGRVGGMFRESSEFKVDQSLRG
jgi:hypothetical protein